MTTPTPMEAVKVLQDAIRGMIPHADVVRAAQGYAALTATSQVEAPASEPVAWKRADEEGRNGGWSWDAVWLMDLREALGVVDCDVAMESIDALLTILAAPQALPATEQTKPFPAPGAWFPVGVLGQPMREYESGKWESAKWPSEQAKPIICATCDDTGRDLADTFLPCPQHTEQAKPDLRTIQRDAAEAAITARLQGLGLVPASPAKPDLSGLTDADRKTLLGVIAWLSGAANWFPHRSRGDAAAALQRLLATHPVAQAKQHEFCTDGGKPLVAYTPPKLDHDWGDPAPLSAPATTEKDKS